MRKGLLAGVLSAAVLSSCDEDPTDPFDAMPPLVSDAIMGSTFQCVDGAAAGFHCSDVALMSFLPLKDLGGDATELNDIWGWTDSATGIEYALVGRTDGVAFVSLEDPETPVFLGELPKTQGSASSPWRDLKVYADHVFIVADGAGLHGMQVFDLRQLRAVSDPPAIFSPTTRYDGIASAHNIVINEESGFAYVVGSRSGGETCGGGLHMIDVSDPVNPTFVGCFSDNSTGRASTGYTHDAQCVNYNGPDPDYQARELCFGSNETALSIADVTDKTNPRAISTASYPNVGYVHQGWVSKDQRYFFIDDEADELTGLASRTRTLVWDIEDLDDPILAAEHIGMTTSSDHNLYVRDNLMYQSNYSSGLRILDVSDPVRPVEVGFFDSVPQSDRPGFEGSWSNYPFFDSGTIVFTSRSEGLFVVTR
jgi:choice-of-anchor B domain-containing protein